MIVGFVIWVFSAFVFKFFCGLDFSDACEFCGYIAS